MNFIILHYFKNVLNYDDIDTNVIDYAFTNPYLSYPQRIFRN